MPERKIGVQITAQNLSAGAFTQLNNDLTKVQQNAERTGTAFSRMTSALTAPTRAIGNIVNQLGRLGMASLGVQAITQSARGLMDMLGIGLNSAIEDATAKFTAFTKSTAESAKIIKLIRTEADKTPFTFQDMADAASGLMSVVTATGEDLLSLLRTAEVLAASNPMQGLVGAAFSLREAVSGDFQSIIDRFNLPRTLLNALKAQGVPALEAVRKAMLAMGFDMDLVSNLAKTATGRWSTLQDTFDGVRRRISEPLFNRLKEGMESLQNWFDDNKASVDEWADRLGTGIVQGVEKVIAVAKQLKVQWDETSEAGQTGILVTAALLTVGGPFIAAVTQSIRAVWGIATAFNGAILKGSILIGVAAAVGAAFEAALYGGFDFDKVQERWKSNMAQFGRDIEGVGLKLAGALGVDQKEIARQEQILDIQRQIHDMEPVALAAKTRQLEATKELARAEAARQDALARQGTQRDIFGRPMEFADIYKDEAAAIKRVEAAQKELASATDSVNKLEAQRVGLLSDIEDIEANLGGALAMAAAQGAGDLTKWLGEQLGIVRLLKAEIAGVGQVATVTLPNIGAGAQRAAQAAGSVLTGGGVVSTGTGKSPLERALDKAKDYADELTDALNAAKSKMQDLLNTPIKGEKAYSDKAFKLEQQIKALQLKEVNLKLAKAPERALKGVQDQIERLQLQAQKVDLERDLKFDPLHRKLQEASEDIKEMPFATLLRGIQDTKREIDSLSPRVDAATATWKGMEKQLKLVEEQAANTAAALASAAGAGAGPIYLPTARENRNLGPGDIYGRAGGGEVWPGQMYVVGEKHAELFSPRVPGTIYPEGPGGGNVVNINAPLVSVGQQVISGEADEDRAASKAASQVATAIRNVLRARPKRPLGYAVG